uniref:FA complementation group C n=1 Tax=Tetraodon nigroviridis TaxID=99883 RepID=H3C3Z6_TETNG
MLTVQEMQFWLDKAVAWGQAETVETQRDTCQHLSRLKDFIQQLLTHINSMVSFGEKRFIFTEEILFLHSCCDNCCFLSAASSRSLLLRCLWGLFSEHPGSAVERKANQWIRNIFVHLLHFQEGTCAWLSLRHGNDKYFQQEYFLLGDLVVCSRFFALYNDSLTLNDTRITSFLCVHVHVTADLCWVLLFCLPFTPPLFSTSDCGINCFEHLRLHFTRELNHGFFSTSPVLMEEQHIISLWCHNLPSLEESVLTLLESVLTNKESSPQKLEQLLEQTLLPKACAQHCSMFLVVNDIFSRSFLKQAEGTESIHCLIHTFTRCFLRELALVQHQNSVPLKAWFPQSPQSLLMPLLTLPSEMHPEAWRHHLKWLSDSLKRVTEEEEEADRDLSAFRGPHGVFEAWFLLVQCVHWVQAAAQLLVTLESRDCGPLLWLVTFYHHPTNRGHHRALQLVHAREALDHLRALFSALNPPLPVGSLQSVMTLLSPQQQQPSSALLTVNLLVNFAVFSRQTLSGSAEILHTVLDQSGLVSEAARVLASLGLLQKGGSCQSSDADRVQLRIQKLQHTLTHM